MVRRQKAKVIVVSEYGIGPVTRCVHPNRLLRKHGLLMVRMERGLEQLDAGASPAFAVADHQIAHIYINDARRKEEVRRLFEQTPGVKLVLGEVEKNQYHIDHPRAGDLVLVADSDCWFSYYFWQNDKFAPDYARTVDIHKKPGYDPVEML